MADNKAASQQQTDLPPDPDGLGGGDHPEVEDTAGLGGWVWIVLFGSVMALSIVANLLMTSCVLFNRKKHSVVYFLLIFMFAINLVDYSLLVFEFSLGMGHEYPYGASACTLYQISVRGNPILQAATVLVLLHYAAGMYCNLEAAPRPTSGSGNSSRSETTVTCSRTNNFVVFFTILAGLLVAEALFSVPTACFAAIVTVEEKHYCEIDLASIAPIGGQQKAISLFYLLYSAIFSFWLPLLIAAVPMTRLYRSANSDKYPEVSVVLSTASSFFVFFFLHGSVVLARHVLDASGIQLSTYHSWMIKVAQSLLWLVAYFWHFTRPALAILLDPDLKQEVARFFGSSNGDYANVESSRRPHSTTTATLLVPLATSTTTTTTVATTNNATTLKTDVEKSSEVEVLLQNADESDIC